MKHLNAPKSATSATENAPKSVTKNLTNLAKKLAACLLAAAAFAASTAGTAANAQTITDMRGKAVKLPDKLEKIATISDGFVEGVMTNFKVIDKVKVIASWAFKRDYKYDFETASGERYSHRGWNTQKYLHPWLNDLVCINSAQGNIIDFEALAEAAPDAVILRVGDCTVRGDNADALGKTIDTIEALGLPLVVLYSPSYFKNSAAVNDLSSMKDELRVLGAVFGKEAEAAALSDELFSIVEMITERAARAKERPKVLYIGLNSGARKKGGAGTAWGTNTPESYIIERIANAQNAYAHAGTNVLLSAEQIAAIDPDVVILPTSNGYHPARELLEAPYYENLRGLRAVQAGRVYAMPWTPMNCARRLEFGLDMLIIAKAAHPAEFADINVFEFAKGLYKKLYFVDDATAEALANEQILGWAKEF